MAVNRNTNPFIYVPADNDGADIEDLNPAEAYEAGVRAALKGFDLKESSENPFIFVPNRFSDGSDLEDLPPEVAYEVGVSVGWDFAI